MEWIKGISPIWFPDLGIKIDPPAGIAIGNFTIQFYGVIIAIGLLLAVIYGLKRKEQFGLNENDILDGVLWIVPVAIIFARVYYCIFSWEEFADDPVSVLYIWKGGIAIYGSVIGAVLGVLIHCAVKKLRIGAVLDLTVLGFLIGQMIGRWGNFFNREAFGAETDSFLRMGLLLTEDRFCSAQVHYYHPTFLYESLWNLVGFVALHFLSKKRQYDGQIALGYVFWYGLGRTFIEGLRVDSLYIGSMRVSQLLAAITCFAAAALLIFNALRKHDRSNLFVNVVARRNTGALEGEEAEPAQQTEEAEETEQTAETEE